MTKGRRVLCFGLLGWMIISCSMKIVPNHSAISASIVQEAKSYCVKNKMDTALFIYVNMKIHSGKNRLLVYDFKKDSLLLKGLCAHGSCNGSTGPGYSGKQPKFNNIPNSYCSSLGKYKVGKRAWSKWGINVHYKLHGMDSTNSKAFERVVVLHSYDGVPNHEVYPNYAMTSWGCPMVSNEVMKQLDSLLKKHRNVLLWVVN